MASRPKHVASLSDKIAGLKFMQRAKAVQDQHQQAGPSSTTSTATQVSMAPRNEVVQKYSAEPEDINEEHWSLPVSRHSTIKQSTSSTSVITHEPGWNAWLNEAEDSQPSASTAAPRLSSRRSFGTWTKKRKSKEPSTSDTKRSQTPLSDEESLKDSSDDDSDASEENIESKGFIKPGSIKSDTSSKKGHKQNNGRGQSAGRKSKDERKERDKGTKRPSRDALSGFPDNSSTQKKNKKPKTH